MCFVGPHHLPACGCPVTSTPPQAHTPSGDPPPLLWLPNSPLAKVRLGSRPLPTRPGPVIQEPTLHEPRTTSLPATLRGHPGQMASFHGHHACGIWAERTGGLSATGSPPQAQRLAWHLLVGSPPPSRPRGPRVQDLCPPCSRCLPGRVTGLRAEWLEPRVGLAQSRPPGGSGGRRRPGPSPAISGWETLVRSPEPQLSTCEMG